MNFKKTKEYIPRKEKKEHFITTDPEHEYMFYDITSDLTRIIEFKENYINNLLNIEFSLYKLISTNNEWFHTKGLFETDKFFENGLIKYEANANELSLFIKTFILDNDYNHYKCVKIENEIVYIYSPSYPAKKGNTYTLRPVIIINERLYSLIMLMNKKFDLINNLEDVNNLKDYFKVSDMPYAVKNEYYLENKLKNKEITIKEYKSLLSSYQIEEEVVKILKKN